MDLPHGLEERILARIHEEAYREKRRTFFIYASTVLASVVGLVRSGAYAVEYGKQSGFFQYISLLFSEQGGIVSYWREWSLSLAESFPIMGAILFFTAVGLGVWSLSRIINLPTYGMERYA
jgi:hypothetical protein